MLRILFPHCQRSTRLLLSSCGTSGALHVLAAAVIVSLGTLSAKLYPPPHGINSVQLTASVITVAAAVDGEPLPAAVPMETSPRDTSLAQIPDQTDGFRKETPVSAVRTAMTAFPTDDVPHEASGAPKRRQLAELSPPPAAPRQIERTEIESPPLPTSSQVPSIAASESAGRQQPTPATIYSPRPEYPAEALQQGIEGRVVLRVEIDAAGKVTATKVLRSSGSKLLDEAARRTVLKWRFDPPRRLGRPVASKIAVPIRFEIQD